MRHGKQKWRLICFLLAAAVLADSALLMILRTDRRDGPGEAETAGICREIAVFPIPDSAKEGKPGYGYADSWLAERTFGGERRHEGCDIMLPENVRGVYPVVSMTDGVVEKLGWLRLGGWRIGIRSASGVYYYYAHLESYSPGLAEGSRIAAGEFLGFAGDSGYGEEGTTGQFAVHLHVGIYVPDEAGRDVAVNPYPCLQYAERKRLVADYACGNAETGP